MKTLIKQLLCRLPLTQYKTRALLEYVYADLWQYVCYDLLVSTICKPMFALEQCLRTIVQHVRPRLPATMPQASSDY